MRKLRISTVAAVIVMGTLGVQACGSSSPDAKSPSAEASASAEKKLDCAFIRNPENCWKTFTMKVQACIGLRPNEPGKLDVENGLCTLPDEEMVKFEQSCDPDGKCEISDLAIGKSGKKCVEFHSSIVKPASETDRGVGSFTLVAAHGTLSYRYDENSKTITCPDGTVYSGPADWKKDLASCEGDGSYESIPSFSFVKSPTVMEGKKKKTSGGVAFEMSSMDTLFDCRKP